MMKTTFRTTKHVAKLAFFGFLLGAHADIAYAQQQAQPRSRRSATDFPELVFTPIVGAPKLQAPQLVMGATGPVLGEGMGWASPAFFDVDGDGKKDLLIGEFGSRMEDNGISMGHFVRVYKNKNKEGGAPQFNDFYGYLWPSQAYNTGSPISVGTWCCLSFTPRFIDLDQDGHVDLISGQYEPGFVTWFRGSERGFSGGERLPQFGDQSAITQSYNADRPWTDPDNWAYWRYSSADMGDLDGDGLADLITGGNTLRISKNVGTKARPSFGRRELLLDTAGNPLTTLNTPDTMLGYHGDPTYGHSMIPFVADWDGDGLLDLLVSNLYATEDSQTITFFRGVAKKNKGVPRFEPGVVLFKAKDGGKAMPGSYMHLSVTDWNEDGINDLLIGTSIAIRDGRFDPELAWSWEIETKSLKQHAAYYSEEDRQRFDGYIENSKSDPKWYEDTLHKFYGKPEYKNLAHQGYVYIMLGKK